MAQEQGCLREPLRAFAISYTRGNTGPRLIRCWENWISMCEVLYLKCSMKWKLPFASSVFSWTPCHPGKDEQKVGMLLKPSHSQEEMGPGKGLSTAIPHRETWTVSSHPKATFPAPVERWARFPWEATAYGQGPAPTSQVTHPSCAALAALTSRPPPRTPRRPPCVLRPTPVSWISWTTGTAWRLNG